MKISTSLRIIVVGALALVAMNVPAQQYPSKVVRFVVPYTPGAGTDAVGRAISQKLSDMWGQQVIVDNRPGAQGNIGVAFIASAPPDGYTLGLTDTGTIAIAPWTTKDLPYHPLRDMVHVTLASSQPYLVVAHPGISVNTLQELAALAKSKPGTLSFASTSQGNQLTGELFKMMTGTNILHVPYKGGGQAITDLLGGQVSLMFASAASSVPHVNSKKLRALAVTGSSRLPTLPDVPTVKESGFPDLVVTSWYGVAVAAGTPREIVAKLNANIVQVLKQPDVIAQLNKFGLTAEGNSTEELTAFVKSEYERWGAVVKGAGITAQ